MVPPLWYPPSCQKFTAPFSSHQLSVTCLKGKGNGDATKMMGQRMCRESVPHRWTGMPSYGARVQAHPESAIEWVFIFSYFPSQANWTVGSLHPKNNNEHDCFSCSSCPQDCPRVSPLVMLSLTGQQDEYSILLQVRPSHRREQCILQFARENWGGGTDSATQVPHMWRLHKTVLVLLGTTPADDPANRG